MNPDSKSSRSPGDFLKRLIGSTVIVRLHSSTEFHGRLVSLDGYLNIALSNAEERLGSGKSRIYGDAFIRGNNVLYIRAL
jgi:U6 snRNA-associated Sm-like protein LSm6